jgi:hypothetical protein
MTSRSESKTASSSLELLSSSSKVSSLSSSKHEESIDNDGEKAHFDNKENHSSKTASANSDVKEEEISNKESGGKSHDSKATSSSELKSISVEDSDRTISTSKSTKSEGRVKRAKVTEESTKGVRPVFLLSIGCLGGVLFGYQTGSLFFLISPGGDSKYAITGIISTCLDFIVVEYAIANDGLKGFTTRFSISFLRYIFLCASVCFI